MKAEASGAMDARRLALVARITGRNRATIAIGPDKRPQRRYLPQARLCSQRIVARLGRDTAQAPADGDAYYAWVAELLLDGDQATRHPHLRNLAPPRGVHWIGRKSGLFFDLINADLFAEAATAAGAVLGPGTSGLDFGCSSGRTIRTLLAGYPEIRWTGVDPIEASIAFARAAFPCIGFVRNALRPPVAEIADASFDIGYSFSVWSHFSAPVARAWLREAARLFRPGGLFVVSTHGYGDLVQRLRADRRSPLHLPADRVERILDALDSEGFFFASDLLAKKRTVVKSDDAWGQTWVAPAWMERAAADEGWSVAGVLWGRWGSRQDLYLLRRAAPG